MDRLPLVDQFPYRFYAPRIRRFWNLIARPYNAVALLRREQKVLAIDLQGSIYTLPSNGGTAKRVTDVFNDARQPSWSADGQWIAFQGYRDGVFHIWSVASDGSSQTCKAAGCSGCPPTVGPRS